MTSAPFDPHSSESHAYNKTRVLTLARMTTRAEHNISWSHTDKTRARVPNTSWSRTDKTRAHVHARGTASCRTKFVHYLCMSLNSRFAHFLLSIIMLHILLPPSMDSQLSVVRALLLLAVRHRRVCVCASVQFSPNPPFTRALLLAQPHSRSSLAISVVREPRSSEVNAFRIGLPRANVTSRWW